MLITKNYEIIFKKKYMSKQKTIIITSIYANLWGTEFGGRPSRQNHYKLSLLSIMKMNPDKVICYTSQEELQSLEEHFYDYHGINKELLEFKIFDLKQSKYFEKISSLKDVEHMKTFDRCFEIQYNKFFWTDSLFEIHDYDKVYWFDAGLSHGGLFPDKFAYGNGYERHYNFNLFNPSFLEKINSLSDDKFLIVCKNNSGGFYWSQTIPEKYYGQYKKDYHSIGGFFGGTPKKFKEISKDFDNLLFNLLRNESELFMEEQIMSCLYYNNEENYEVLKFDDWYKKEWHDENTFFFYEIFLTENSTKKQEQVTQEKILINSNMENVEKEIVLNKSNNICVTAVSIQNSNNIGKDYSVHAKRMAESYLEYTDFDVVIVTDNPKSFSDINNDRLKIIDYDSRFDERKMVSNFFNYHLKRYAILVAKELNYQTILYVDCDCYIVGWDMESFLNKLREEFDIAFVTHAHPQLGDLRRNYKHFQEKIDLEFEGLYYESLDMAPNPAETHVLIKNNEKLTEFLDFWDKISKNNKHNNPTYHDGVYFGTSGIHAKMNMIGVDLSSNFTNFCRISHGDGTLNFFGHKIS
jgi:hypothetical protein